VVAAVEAVAEQAWDEAWALAMSTAR
jgi:hypothetical protein